MGRLTLLWFALIGLVVAICAARNTAELGRDVSLLFGAALLLGLLG